MQLQKIPFRSTHAFNGFFLKYMEKDPALQSYYSRFPDPGSFKIQLDEKSSAFPTASRKVLAETLKRQYAKIKAPGASVKGNIEALLDDKTFTVTTGHQLNIFTGPLYFIYKIVTVINTCKSLSKLYPGFHFVPIYWMASEDHDYEEIKSFRLYEKIYTWDTRQEGAVGRFATGDLKKVLDELPGDVTVFRDAYQKNATLGEAVRQYVNNLFANEGLIVVDADDRELKKLFVNVIKDDLFDHTPFKKVTETNARLEAAGFKPPVNPREINFFYLDTSLRARLEKNNGVFTVVDTDLTFSDEDIQKKIEQEPEKFSPNVILRPVYQETILPNLAYVGGPAELVYWLELKEVFTHFKVPFPILMPRNFALVINESASRKMAKTRIDIIDYFGGKDALSNQWVIKNSSHDLSLTKSVSAMEGIFRDIQERCEKIDPTLGPMAAAEGKRMRSAFEKIEKKMIRAEKRKQAASLRQTEDVKDALFPNGSLQERTDNFLNFYQQDPDFINKLLKQLDPFDFQFNVLTYP